MITTREELGDSAEKFECEYRKCIRKVIERTDIPINKHDELIESAVSKFMNTEHSNEDVIQFNESMKKVRKKAIDLVESELTS